MSRPSGIPTSIPVMLVTPTMAQEWLAKRHEDYERQVRQGRVDGMARDMTTGRFRFIGDPIRFSTEEGYLEDGQHRLLAIVQSGIPQYFPVVNIPAEARHVIDTGARRSIADMLRKEGIATGVRGNVFSAIANKVSSWELGHTGSRGTYRPTADEQITYIKRNQELLTAATDIAAQVVKYALPASASSIGAMWYLTHLVDAKAADEFWVEQVIKSGGINEGDPAWALRDRIQRESRAGRRMLPIEVMLFGAVAWNHYRAGNTITRLQQPRGGFTNRALTLK